MITTTVLEVLSQILIGKYCFSRDGGKSTELFKVVEVRPYMAHETIPKGWKKKIPKDLAPEDQIAGLRLIGKSTKEGDKPRQRIVKIEELLEFEFFKTS